MELCFNKVFNRFKSIPKKLYLGNNGSNHNSRPPFLSWRVQQQDERGEGGGEGTVPQQPQTPSAFSANAPPLMFPSSANEAMYGPAAGPYTSSQQAHPFAHQQQRYQQQQAAAAVGRYYPPSSGASSSASASIGMPQSAKSGASSTSKGFPTGGQQQQQTMAQLRAPR